MSRRLLLVGAGDFLSAIEDAMSTKQKLTPWFPPHVKPARVGEYNATLGRSKKLKRWWNGRAWSTGYLDEDDEDEKARKRSRLSSYQSFPWRGLADDPYPHNYFALAA